jgi:uncharacterized protein
MLKLMFVRAVFFFILVLVGSAPASAQESVNFTVFLRGTAIGGEEATVRRTDAGWTITAAGRLAEPLDLATRRFLMRYDSEWRPLELSIDALSRGAVLTIRTSFGDGSAVNEVTQAGQTQRKTDPITRDAVVLPNLFFSSYEALAARLGGLKVGAALKAYIAPQAEITVTITGISEQKIETAKRTISARTYNLTFENPGAAMLAELWTDERGRMLRFVVPAQSLAVVRDDIASVAARPQTISREGDESVKIPASGFNLAGTLSQPRGTAPEGAKGRFPAIVLVPGSGPTDRDETVAGIPVFGQLAAFFADAGYFVIRFDKRGVGQSGGRMETATLQDYAEDVLAMIRFLKKRKDVDGERIAVFGHNEGGWVGLIAASRTEDIRAVVLAASASGSGGDLVLEQQRHLLDLTTLTSDEKQVKVDLQKRIQAAVLGQGPWDDVPPELRKQADTPWFQSMLRFNPSQVMPKVKQPLLMLQGELDRQVPAHHADALADLARARWRKARPDSVEVRRFPDLNHLFVKAKSGEVSEYGELAGGQVDPQVAAATVEWLKTEMNRK